MRATERRRLALVASVAGHVARLVAVGAFVALVGGWHALLAFWAGLLLAGGLRL